MARTRTRVAGKAAKGSAKVLRRSPAARKAAARAAKTAAKGTAKTGKVGAKGAARGASARRSGGSRLLRFGLLAAGVIGLGAVISRLLRGGGSTDSTGQHSPDAGSPAGQRGETWGSGTPVGTAGAGDGTPPPGSEVAPPPLQEPEDPNRTGADREYSDPASGPLIGREHGTGPEEIPEQQEEVEQRIRTRLGEDPRTADMPRPNVEVNDGVAELRGPAPSEEAKQAAGEIAAETEGVVEVRNMIVVS